MRSRSFHKVFGRLLSREIFHDWAQSLAIVSIGAIAVTLFVGLQANSASMEERLNEMISVAKPADIYVATDPRSLKAEDDSDRILSCLGDEDYLESRFLTYCNMESHNVALVCSYSLPTISMPYDVTKTTDSSSTNYCYIDETIAYDLAEKNKDVEVLGREVEFSFDLTGFGIDASTLGLLDSFVREGKENPFRTGTLPFYSTVTGIMRHPENTTKANPMPLLTLVSNKVFHRAIVDSLTDFFTPLGARLIYREGFFNLLGWGDGELEGSVVNFPSANQYLIRLRDASTADEKKAKINQAYESKLENNLYNVQTLDETTFMSTLRGEIDQAKKLTMVFPVVFFVVAVLVIITTLRQNILKRRQEIGTFKALGLTKGEIHAHFLAQTGILVSLASAIGLIIGPFLLPAIMAHKYDILYTLPNRQYCFPVLPSVLSIGAFLLVALAATVLITYREIALKPVESMRPKTMKMHRSYLPPSSKKQSAVVLSAKMAWRNILYDPVKALMVVLGLAGCTALLVCGFGIDNTLDYDIHTDPYVNAFHCEMAQMLPAQSQEKIQLDFGEVQDQSGERLISSFQPYDRVSLEVLSDTSTYTTFLFVLGEQVSYDGAKVPEHMQGDFPKDEIMLSTKAADRLKVGVGDKVKFYLSSTYIEIKIYGIYDAFYGNSIIIHYDCPLLSAPYNDFQSAWVDSKPGVDLETLRSSLLEVDYVRLVDTSAEWIARVESIVSSISTMTMAIKIFAILLAIVVIYNLGLLNFRERVREIATLKVVGFHTAEIAAGLLIEALSMAAIGIAIGTLFGFPFMQLVLMINQIDVIHYIYMIYPVTYIAAAFASFFAAIVVNISLMIRIKSVHAVESLKSIE